MSQQCRILSIQSHVVRGYVGNKAAAFALQLLGYHVDFINTVQFTSVSIKDGSRATAEEFRTLLSTLPLASGQALKTNGAASGYIKSAGNEKTSIPFAGHKYLLTGYIGSAAQLEEIVAYVVGQKLSAEAIGEKYFWLCDPVMGDNGTAYVVPALMSLYQSVLHLTDIITPNQFELEFLSNTPMKPISSLEDAIHRCQILHERGPRTIICTSLEFDTDQRCSKISVTGGGPLTIPQGELILLASEYVTLAQNVFIIRIKKINRYMAGTGDLAAAAILDGFERFNSIELACEHAVAIMQGVMRHTLKHENQWNEIDVVGGRHEIINPSLVYKSEKLDITNLST